VIGSTTERIQFRAEELRSESLGIVGVAGDLTRKEAAEGLVAAAAPRLEAGTVTQMELDTWHRSLNRNLDTAFLLTKAAAPEMARQRCPIR